MPELVDEIATIQDEILNETPSTDTDEVLDSPSPSGKKGKRPRMNENNKYVYDVPSVDQANPIEWAKHIKAANVLKDSLTYTDGTKVEKAARFSITKDLVYKTNDDGEETNEVASGSLIAVVVCPSKSLAADYFLQHKGYSIDKSVRATRAPGSGRGRAKTKITPAILQFGAFMEVSLFKGEKITNGFKDTATDAEKKAFNDMFGDGGEFSHYLNEDKTWKTAT